MDRMREGWKLGSEEARRLHEFSNQGLRVEKRRTAQDAWRTMLNFSYSLKPPSFLAF